MALKIVIVSMLACGLLRAQSEATPPPPPPPMGVVRIDAAPAALPGIDKSVLSHLSREMRNGGLAKSLGSAANFDAESFFEDACMLLEHETTITIYQTVTFSTETGTRTILRFIPGDRSGRNFREASLGRAMEAFKFLEKNGDKADFEKITRKFKDREVFVDNWMCGIIVIDKTENEVSIPPVNIQKQYGYYKFADVSRGG